MISKRRKFLILFIIFSSLSILYSCFPHKQGGSINNKQKQKNNENISSGSYVIETVPIDNSASSSNVPSPPVSSPSPGLSQATADVNPKPSPSPSASTSITPLANSNRCQSKIQTDLFKYLSDDNNQEAVKNRAKELNNGDQHNSCVYFASEALRRVGMDLTIQVCNTGKLANESNPEISFTYQLLKRGWKVEKDLSLLLPGDLCFTTLNSDGISTHVYTFMGWEKEGSTDYAYVCDNQSYDYGTTYHKRNVRIALPNKEAFFYFMYKPEV